MIKKIFKTFYPKCPVCEERGRVSKIKDNKDNKNKWEWKCKNHRNNIVKFKKSR